MPIPDFCVKFAHIFIYASSSYTALCFIVLAHPVPQEQCTLEGRYNSDFDPDALFAFIPSSTQQLRHNRRKFFHPNTFEVRLTVFSQTVTLDTMLSENVISVIRFVHL